MSLISVKLVLIGQKNCQTFYCHMKCLVIKCTCVCPAVIHMKTTFVCLKLNVMQNHIYLILQTNQISPKTASNITQFDLCNIGKYYNAHNWNKMSGNFVQRTEKVAENIYCKACIENNS